MSYEPPTDSAPPASDFGSLVARIWQEKWLVLACTIAGFALGVIYLHVATPTYTTELKVTAAASSSNSIANRLGSLGGLAAVAGLPIGGSSKAEPFDVYLEALTSRSVADALAQDERIMTTIFAREWDAGRRSWRRPPPTLAERARAVLGLGLPWRSPDGARLNEYLEREIVITRSAKSPITVVGYDARDPAFGVYLLDRINHLADNQVRAAALRQATQYKAYLTAVLPSVALADVRGSLAQTLSQQYESVMMASSSVAYSASALGAPDASVAPSKPKLTIVLALGLLLGAIVGLVIALVDFRRLFGLKANTPAPVATLERPNLTAGH